MAHLGQRASGKVVKDGRKIRIVVRRVTFTPDQKVAFKEMLTTDAEWVRVPEASRIPDECYLYVDPDMDFWDKEKEQPS